MLGTGADLIRRELGSIIIIAITVVSISFDATKEEAHIGYEAKPRVITMGDSKAETRIRC